MLGVLCETVIYFQQTTNTATIVMYVQNIIKTEYIKNIHIVMTGNFGTMMRPLRRLTCNGVPWEWGKREQHSFEKLKAALSAKTMLAYFDPKKIFTRLPSKEHLRWQ